MKLELSEGVGTPKDEVVVNWPALVAVVSGAVGPMRYRLQMKTLCRSRWIHKKMKISLW